MKIIQTNRLKKTVKRLHKNQKELLDEAIRAIVKDITIGEAKIGDLAGIRVYKFKMLNQLTLLAYSYEDESITLTLIAIGSHENFYRDIKN